MHRKDNFGDHVLESMNIHEWTGYLPLRGPQYGDFVKENG